MTSNSQQDSSQNSATNIALEALLWLLDDPQIAGGFLGVSGATLDDVRAQANNPEFLGFVLDYILSDDQNVISCASQLQIPPLKLLEIRQKLPGGDTPEWT